MADKESVDIQENGRAKWFTNSLRSGSQIIDLIPMDVVPVLGTLASDASAAALSALAAGVDAVDKVLQGDFDGAVEEAVMGAADTAIVAIPGAEYIITPINFTFGCDVRKSFRKAAGGAYNFLRGRSSSVFGEEEIEKPAGKNPESKALALDPA